MGEEYLDGFATLRDGELLLHILRVTDSCKDRLAGFIHWKDRSSLDQAVAVARAQPGLTELSRIRDWMHREGAQDEWKEFERCVSGSTGA